MTLSFRSVFAPALAVAMTLAAVGCSSNKASNTNAATTPSNDPVVATYDGKSITQSQLDKKISDQLYEARRQGLEQMIMEDLVQTEAKKEGKTEEEYLKEQIEKKVPPPPEAQLQQFYDQLKAAGRLPPNATFDQMKDQLAAAMTQPQQKERAQELFKDLRQKANVQIKLQQPLPEKKEVEAVGPSKGPKDAPVTIVEYSDFQCPFCGRAKSTVDEVMQQYPGKVRLVFRNFPLEFHQNAQKAAEAGMCANEQGKFWEMYDLLFKNQDKLTVPDLKEHAKSLGLDTAKFDQCLDSGAMAAKVKEDQASGQKLGVNGTPAFFINGYELSGARPIEDFKNIIDQELQAKK